MATVLDSLASLDPELGQNRDGEKQMGGGCPTQSHSQATRIVKTSGNEARLVRVGHKLISPNLILSSCSSPCFDHLLSVKASFPGQFENLEKRANFSN